MFGSRRVGATATGSAADPHGTEGNPTHAHRTTVNRFPQNSHQVRITGDRCPLAPRAAARTIRGPSTRAPTTPQPRVALLSGGVGPAERPSACAPGIGGDTCPAATGHAGGRLGVARPRVRRRMLDRVPLAQELDGLRALVGVEGREVLVGEVARGVVELDLLDRGERALQVVVDARELLGGARRPGRRAPGRPRTTGQAITLAAATKIATETRTTTIVMRAPRPSGRPGRARHERSRCSAGLDRLGHRGGLRPGAGSAAAATPRRRRR